MEHSGTRDQGKLLLIKSVVVSKKGQHMETWYYDVVRIEGDYAYLKRTDKEIDDEKMVARALLPPEIMIGSHLKYEMMQYEMN